MIYRQRILVLSTIFVGLAGVATQATGDDTRQAELPPTADGARFPALSAFEDGRVAMVWMERDRDSVPMVRTAIRGRNGGWSAARTVVRDAQLFVNFADIPRIAWLSSNELAVSWLQRNGTGRYDYAVRTARSRDGGQTWTPTATAHDTTETGEHGFVSLLPVAGRSMALSYLNGSKVNEPGGATQLAYGEIDRKGTLALSQIIDARVCDCCQTAAAMTTDGPVIVFRDRSENEIRDIAITRHLKAGWTKPEPVHADLWRITGCPVNGPAIGAIGRRVAVAWFTAARDTAKVQVAFSDDAGGTFFQPIRIDGGAPAGHVDVVLAHDGSAFVSWLERGAGSELFVRVRRAGYNGSTSSPVTIGTVNGIRPGGFPAMVAQGDGLLIAFTVPGSPSRVRVQSLSRSAFR